MSVLGRYDLTKNYPNGDRYVGEATDCNVKDGKGKFTWASGAAYEGEWKRDMMHGQGWLRVPGPQGFSYRGPFLKGHRHGEATCEYNDDRRYSGQWAGDVFEGQGTLRGGQSDDFVEYCGPFYQSLRHGVDGRCTYRNGDVYYGSWCKGLRHGPNAHFESSTTAVYDGEFKDDEPSGRGTIQFANGIVYRGDHHRFVRHGTGTETSDKGASTYTGSYLNNLREGHGVSIEIIGGLITLSYDGQWERGKKHGHGVYSCSGDITDIELLTQQRLLTVSSPRGASLADVVARYEGIWHMDEMHGEAMENVVVLHDGSHYRGGMKHNAFDGRGSHHGRLAVLGGDDPSGVSASLTRRLNYDGDFISGERHGFGNGYFDVVDGGGAFHSGDNRVDVNDTSDADPCCRRALDKLSCEYHGRWQHDAPDDDAGRIRWSEATYCGSVRFGFPDGHGTLAWSTAGQTYTGNFRSGYREGSGRLSLSKTGDAYEGEWRADMKHGKGSYYCEASHDTYTGEWQSNAYHGHGVEVLYNRSVYDGQFVHGRRHGYGVLRSEGGTKYEGQFANGEFDGEGSLLIPSQGKKHIGHFSKGRCHGFVTTTFDNGCVYAGNYVHGETYGHGEMKYINGDRYVGEFGAEASREGKGMFYFSEGSKLECVWVANRLHGSGYHISRDGTRKKRVYVEGTLVEEIASIDLLPIESQQVTCDLEAPTLSPTPREKSPAENDEPPVVAPNLALPPTPTGLPLSLAGLTSTELRSRSTSYNGAQMPKRVLPNEVERSLSGEASDDVEVSIANLTQSIAKLNETIQSLSLGEIDAAGAKRLQLLKTTRIREAGLLVDLLRKT